MELCPRILLSFHFSLSLETLFQHYSTIILPILSRARSVPRPNHHQLPTLRPIFIIIIIIIIETASHIQTLLFNPVPLPALSIPNHSVLPCPFRFFPFITISSPHGSFTGQFILFCTQYDQRCNFHTHFIPILQSFCFKGPFKCSINVV